MNPADRPRGQDSARLLGAGLAVTSLLSTWISGAAGLLVVDRLGPFLAMGGQMYLRLNAEPVQPTLATPWLAALGAALLPLPWVVKKRWAAAALAAIPFALLPWWQLYRLYRLAGPPGPH